MENNTIYSVFKDWAERHPHHVAIAEDGRSITYAGLDALANGIMAKFADRSHSYIGIVMNHGIEMIAAILAVLKSGAAYVLNREISA